MFFRYYDIFKISIVYCTAYNIWEKSHLLSFWIKLYLALRPFSEPQALSLSLSFPLSFSLLLTLSFLFLQLYHFPGIRAKFRSQAFQRNVGEASFQSGPQDDHRCIVRFLALGPMAYWKAEVPTSCIAPPKAMMLTAQSPGINAQSPLSVMANHRSHHSSVLPGSKTLLSSAWNHHLPVQAPALISCRYSINIISVITYKSMLLWQINVSCYFQLFTSTNVWIFSSNKKILNIIKLGYTFWKEKEKMYFHLFVKILQQQKKDESLISRIFIFLGLF